MHTHPEYWEDPFAWKPSRWIMGAPRPETDSEMPSEELWTPAAHTYSPWSDGPQSCPGAKFSKVEAVAILTCLFKDHRLGIQKGPGEGEEAARKRITRCINDATGNTPKDARCEPRQNDLQKGLLHHAASVRAVEICHRSMCPRGKFRGYRIVSVQQHGPGVLMMHAELPSWPYSPVSLG